MERTGTGGVLQGRAHGLAPHDLLKVLPLQQAWRRHHLDLYADLYADQSHFTQAFRQAIGFTSGQYRKAFGVRLPQDGGELDAWSYGSLPIQEHAMQKPNAMGWFDLYVGDMDCTTTFYETVFQRWLALIGDPTGETVMHSCAADMGTYGAGGALVRSPQGRPGRAAPWFQSLRVFSRHRPACPWQGDDWRRARSAGALKLRKRHPSDTSSAPK